ncbi:MAG: DUF2608 domain-containing protein [Shewanella sp.]|nr:DUF2608 domain-containing protein [Shewanella sp.]
MTTAATSNIPSFAIHEVNGLTTYTKMYQAELQVIKERVDTLSNPVEVHFQSLAKNAGETVFFDIKKSSDQSDSPYEITVGNRPQLKSFFNKNELSGAATNLQEQLNGYVKKSNSRALPAEQECKDVGTDQDSLKSLRYRNSRLLEMDFTDGNIDQSVFDSIGSAGDISGSLAFQTGHVTGRNMRPQSVLSEESILSLTSMLDGVTLNHNTAEVMSLDVLRDAKLSERPLIVIDLDEVILTTNQTKPEDRENPPKAVKFVGDMNANKLNKMVDELQKKYPEGHVIILTDSSAGSVNRKFEQLGIEKSWFNSVVSRTVQQAILDQHKGIRLTDYVNQCSSETKFDSVCMIDDNVKNLKQVQQALETLKMDYQSFHFIGATPEKHILDAQGYGYQEMSEYYNDVPEAVAELARFKELQQ